MGVPSICVRSEENGRWEALRWEQAWRVPGTPSKPVWPGWMMVEGKSSSRPAESGRQGGPCPLGPRWLCPGLGFHSASDEKRINKYFIWRWIASRLVVARGLRRGSGEWLLMGTDFLCRMMKMLWNYVVVLIAQPCEYAKHNWTVHFKRVNFRIHELHLFKNYQKNWWPRFAIFCPFSMCSI